MAPAAISIRPLIRNQTAAGTVFIIFIGAYLPGLQTILTCHPKKTRPEF
jgi:hypothetical protein